MAIEACCFQDDLNACVNLEPDECIARFGNPMGPDTSCRNDPLGSTSEIVCAHQACCIRFLEPDEWECRYGSLAACAGWGGTPQGRFTFCGGSAPFTSYQCGTTDVFTDCCLRDGGRLPNMTPENCDLFGGWTVESGEDCIRLPPPDEQCRRPGPDRQGGRFQWDPDVCQAAPFSYMLDAEGYGMLVSRRRLRAMQADGEPCRGYYVPMMLDADGYGVGLLCQDQSPEGLKRSRMVLKLSAVPPDHRPRWDDVEPIGYGVYVGTYEAPPWTEVLFESPLHICHPPPL